MYKSEQVEKQVAQKRKQLFARLAAESNVSTEKMITDGVQLIE